MEADKLKLILEKNIEILNTKPERRYKLYKELSGIIYKK
jgi:hypothetical protein